LLTQKEVFLTKEEAMQLAACFLANEDSTMHIKLPPPALLKPRRLWTGKQMFSLLMRPNDDSEVRLNMVNKGRNYTRNMDLCSNDSCK